MELLDKNILTLYSSNDNVLIIKGGFSQYFREPNFNNKITDILNKHKTKIDNIKNIKKWDFYKKLSNPFELINQYIKTKKLNLGIADYNPISRAFFKFWEIMYDFQLLENKNMVYGGLAEGPGGFIEAFGFYRRKFFLRNNDIIHCITLKDLDNSNVPGWKNITGYKYNISWGADGTGDLYKLENIINFSNLFKHNKADLVTGDGGFDFSMDYTNQEISAQKLIFCEIVTGLSILKGGGNMVIKIFDMFYKTTKEILYMLTFFFKDVHIVKPHTSRPANSEKYVVCKNFTNISKRHLFQLYDIINSFNNTNCIYLKSLLTKPIPIGFEKCINSYNLYSISNQLKYIIKTYNYLHNDLGNENINQIKNAQCVNSVAWCIKYKFDINKKSRYLNMNSKYNYIPNF